MITAVAVREEGGKTLLSSLQWTTNADYDTITLLAESLSENHQLLPVRVDRFGNVLPGGGAKRCEAARRLGWRKIAVEVMD